MSRQPIDQSKWPKELYPLDAAGYNAYSGFLEGICAKEIDEYHLAKAKDPNPYGSLDYANALTACGHKA